MFKIIGADGKEYGPVSVEQLRQWIAEGRANRDTKVQPEGATDWRPLSEFPELAEALAAQAPPPRDRPTPAETLAGEILARGTRVDIGSCFSRAWALLTGDFWPIVGVTVLILATAVAANAAYVGFVLNGPLLGGLYAYYLKRIRGQPVELGNAFAGFSEGQAFVHLMLASIVTGLLTGLGFCLCILPGIYLAVAWLFALPLVIDRKLEFWDAMEVSRKVATDQWWTLFGLSVLALLLNLAGTLACLIGLAVTLPVTLLAIAYAYEELFGSRPAPGA